MKLVTIIHFKTLGFKGKMIIMRMIKFMRAIKPFENKLWNVISKDRVDMLNKVLRESRHKDRIKTK